VLGWVLTGICYSAGFLGVLYLIGRFAQ